MKKPYNSKNNLDCNMVISLNITKNRSQWEIIKFMLEASYHGCNFTEMSLRSNQSWNQGKVYLNYLLEKKLISGGHSIDGKQHSDSGYKITDKGKMILAHLIQLGEMLI